MKIILITVPLDATPSIFPPLGAMSIANYARKHASCEVRLLNVDALRPSYEEVINAITDYQPDLIGISAVVSTSYAFTKKISLDCKRLMPSTPIVVGGNLGASAEILLKKTGVDFCVLGEGEKVFLNIIRLVNAKESLTAYKNVNGLIFLSKDGELINTGYEFPLESNEIWDVDWKDLEHEGTIDHYFPLMSKLGEGYLFRRDKNTISDNERLGFLTCAKGCVARCTFCHRWDKGIRHIPVDEVMKRLDFLRETYNVKTFNMVAESFGTDKKWLDEFISKIQERNVYWQAGGVRASTVSPELIQRMKASGCNLIIYGNETGSPLMLEIMEKKISIDENYNAVKWAIEAGFTNNITQLVIGMPGESPETIKQTINYVNFCTSLSREQDPRQISINFAQALPGTPLYEFAREKGLIGRDIDSEENYLLSISDKNAGDPLSCINFTDYSRLTLLSWPLLIRIEARNNYLNQFGESHYFKIIAKDPVISGIPNFYISEIEERGKLSWRSGVMLLLRGKFGATMSCYPVIFYRFRRFVKLFTVVMILRSHGIASAFRLIYDDIRDNRSMASPRDQFVYKSLRRIVNNELPIDSDQKAMYPLRKGR